MVFDRKGVRAISILRSDSGVNRRAIFICNLDLETLISVEEMANFPGPWTNLPER